QHVNYAKFTYCVVQSCRYPFRCHADSLERRQALTQIPIPSTKFALPARRVSAFASGVRFNVKGGDMIPTWPAILSILNRGKERSFSLSRKRMNRWRGWSPHLEVLEDRDLLSVTAHPTYVLLNQSGGVNPYLGP